MARGVRGETKTPPPVQTVFPAPGTGAAAAGVMRHQAGRGLSRWAGRERRGVRNDAFPRGKTACGPWASPCPYPLPHPRFVGGFVFFFSLGDSSAEVPWKLASVSRSPDFTSRKSEEARTLPHFQRLGTGGVGRSSTPATGFWGGMQTISTSQLHGKPFHISETGERGIMSQVWDSLRLAGCRGALSPTSEAVLSRVLG